MKITDNTIYALAIETTKILNDSQNELRNVRWCDGEANLDSDYSRLACRACRTAWEKISTDKSIKIECKIPDILIKFTLSNGKTIQKKIELKSSNYTQMSGSTIKKLNINQLMIYCLRPRNKNGIYRVRCSQYHTAMGSSAIDKFQDRTPRPKINFDKMDTTVKKFITKRKDDWVNHYADCALKRITNARCPRSWQDDMIKKIKNKVLNDFIKNTTTEEFDTLKLSAELKELNFN